MTTVGRVGVVLGSSVVSAGRVTTVRVGETDAEGIKEIAVDVSDVVVSGVVVWITRVSEVFVEEIVGEDLEASVLNTDDGTGPL